MSDDDPFPPQGLDLSRPSVARVYDWYLGGTANWAIDRAFGERILSEIPLVRAMAITNRMFLHRAVRRLSKLGVEQFVDVGAGVPTMGNTHAIADELNPESRVVYVDNEPVAVAHSRMLLEEEGDPERHAVVEADLRNPDKLWAQAVDSGVIDPDRPVALLFIAVLHVRQEDSDGEDITERAMERYRELLSTGSYLAISHATDHRTNETTRAGFAKIKRMYDGSASKVIWREHEEIAALFGDFELVEPGMSWTASWRPDDGGENSPRIDFAHPSDSGCWAGVGRKV